MENYFAMWLKKEREARHLSIRELAPKIGYSHSQVAKVERGDAPPTFEFCERTARFFNQPVWKLFIMAGLLDTIPDQVYQNERIKVLLDSFDKLPDQGKEELLRYAAWLVFQYS